MTISDLPEITEIKKQLTQFMGVIFTNHPSNLNQCQAEYQRMHEWFNSLPRHPSTARVAIAEELFCIDGFLDEIRRDVIGFDNFYKQCIHRYLPKKTTLDHLLNHFTDNELIGKQFFNQDKTRGALISPDPSKTGFFRASFFSINGFDGDVSRQSLRDVMEHVIHDGLFIEDKKLEDWAKTFEWNISSSANLDAQKINSHLMTQHEYLPRKASRTLLKNLHDDILDLNVQFPILRNNEKILSLLEKWDSTYGLTPTESTLHIMLQSANSFLEPTIDIWHKTRHFYGLQARGPAIGALPKVDSDSIYLNTDSQAFACICAIHGISIDAQNVRHGIIAYRHQLSENDANDYELKPLSRKSAQETVLVPEDAKKDLARCRSFIAHNSGEFNGEEKLRIKQSWSNIEELIIVFEEISMRRSHQEQIDPQLTLKPR